MADDSFEQGGAIFGLVDLVDVLCLELYSVLPRNKRPVALQVYP